MDKLETLLPLSSEAPTLTNNSSLNPIKLQPGTSPNIIGTTVYTNSSRYSPSTSIRLATIISLVLLSLWANYEASKGFDLTILNANTHTLAGRRFDLLFVSNGRAAELALESSRFIEQMLYPDKTFPRKMVRHVSIRLADGTFTNNVLVSRRHGIHIPVPTGDYLIEISPSVMAQKDAMSTAMTSAVHRGMAYVWLWDGHGTTPQPIIDAMVEYLSVQFKLPSKHYESTSLTSILAGLIQQCEERSKGYVARLNNAMQEKWNERAVSDAFISPRERMCLSHLISSSQRGLSADNPELDLELDLVM